MTALVNIYQNLISNLKMCSFCFLVILLLIICFLLSLNIESYFMASTSTYIMYTWNCKELDHEATRVVLKGHAETATENLTITIYAPLFNDPPNPGGIPGKPFETIWEYEVVEVFLCNDEDQYLEVILSPHGQHYVLIQGGYRNKLKVEMPIEYTATKEKTLWKGEAVIPASYLPPKVTKWNAYAMHGTGDSRHFEALHGDATGRRDKPDFHDLSLFRQLDIQRLLPNNWSPDYNSDIWKEFLSDKSNKDEPELCSIQH